MKFLRERHVVKRTGLSRSTVWRLEKAGEFPKRRQISPGAVGWIEEEVDRFIESRAVVSGPETS